jgi:hypothetical protein
MIIKFIENSEGKLLKKEECNIHKANIYLGVKSIHLDDVQYNVINSTLCIEDDEIQILLQEI